eukprot:1861841-Prymnesium_polylepis.1
MPQRELLTGGSALPSRATSPPPLVEYRAPPPAGHAPLTAPRGRRRGRAHGRGRGRGRGRG